MIVEFLKTYTSRIDANPKKMEIIENTLSTLSEVSVFLFENGIGPKSKQQVAYAACRDRFPDLNSKILQNFVRYYLKKSKKKSPKNPIKPIIILDQNFKVEKSKKASFASHWLTYGKVNYPLFGKYLSEKVTDESKIKQAQIFKRGCKIYCRLVIEEKRELNKPIDFDNGSNVKSFNEIVIDNIKELSDKTQKLKGGKLKDFVHKLTSKIVKDLQNTGMDVLVLEDYESLRQLVKTKSRNEKSQIIEGISKFPYVMFRDLLSYKCLDSNILTMTEQDYQYGKDHSKYTPYESNASSFKLNKFTTRLILSLREDYDSSFFLDPKGDYFCRIDCKPEYIFPIGVELWEKVKDSDLFKDYLAEACDTPGERKRVCAMLERHMTKKKHPWEKSFPKYPGEIYDYSYVRDVIESYAEARENIRKEMLEKCYKELSPYIIEFS